MTLKIRNRNRCLYSIKLKIRQYLYNNLFFLKKYLKLKEIVIKSKGIPHSSKNALFKKVFIETISYCNNDCAFCAASSQFGAKHRKQLMSLELYMKILQELVSIHFAGSLAFHCNNEPLLDGRIVSWIKIARNLLKTNFFYLYTNGLLINVKLANELFETGLNRIIISNYNDVHELNPSIKALVDNSSMLRGEVIVDYRLKTECLGNRAGESPNAKFFLKRPLKLTCLRPLTEMVIGYDGSVPLCCADALWKVSMGSVQKSSLKEVWFSDYFRRVRASLLKGDRSCTEICKVCDALKLPAMRGVRG